MNIVLIDDDRLITTSLKMIIEADQSLHVVAAGSDGSEALPLYIAHQPDIMLMDIRMPGIDGIEAGRKLLNFDPEAKILYLTTFADDQYIIQALRLGARGYILKQNFESLIPALYAIESGQSVYGDDIIARIPDLITTHRQIDWQSYDIREREKQVIEMIADGLNNKEIAARLFLGEGTIRNVLSLILDKLQLRDRTQLAIWYYKNRRSQLE